MENVRKKITEAEAFAVLFTDLVIKIARKDYHGLGEALGDVAMKSGHMTYNAPRGQKMIAKSWQILHTKIPELGLEEEDEGLRMIKECMATLSGRFLEIQPQEAPLEYYIARYVKRKEKKKK